MLGDLSEIQINNVLSSQVLGRMACTNGKEPYIVPVTYTYDGKYIYGQTNEGTKLKMLRKNPNVCFEADMMTDMANWQCVLVYGRFEELKGEQAAKAREILFNRVLGLMTSSTIHAHEHGVTAELDDSNRVKQVMYRIKIRKKTGRFEKK
ncbi:MAG TPA: pyridoxamine 5'-phosphate oxidase family protein [Chitinophagaceae bacterium]|nr:pyridoxamine 5'-phosphate oxidase family protein [Chitinophagaceae bacterium]